MYFRLRLNELRSKYVSLLRPTWFRDSDKFVQGRQIDRQTFWEFRQTEPEFNHYKIKILNEILINVILVKVWRIKDN